jgi:hypothetical protein
MNLGALFSGGPLSLSGIGMAGGPASGIGVMGGAMGGGGQGAPAAAVPGQMADDAAKKKKKEGIAKMLGGMGGDNDLQAPGRSAPALPGVDLQGLLSSLFGG